MDTPTLTNRSKNHRFPAEIISHGVWLYYRFCLSYRDVEALLFVRGVLVSYEAIRKWCRKFGQQYANQLRHRRPQPGDKWHLDEVFLTIHGERHYLWRAVDQDGNMLDILVQRRRDKEAAKKFFRKLLKGCQYVPRVIVTDKLKSYGAAKREILPGVEHRQHQYLERVSLACMVSTDHRLAITQSDWHGTIHWYANRSKQPCGEFASAHAPAGAAHAGIQGIGTCPTVSRGVWPDCPPLSPAPPSLVRARIPARDAAKIRHLAGHHRPSHHRIGASLEVVMPLVA